MPNIFRSLTTIALFAPMVASSQERPLTQDDVKDKWVGKVVTGSTASGVPVELRLQPDGSASVVAGKTSDAGTWRPFAQGFCTTWKKIRANEERCFTGIVQGTTVKVFNPDGSAAGQYTEFR
jgi:hypothetical protein